MKNLTPTEIVELMDKEVSGQDDAKRMLAIALRNRWRIQQLPPEIRRSVKKQNVLLAGPTGSGKTALMRVIRDVLGLPVLEIDITGYSETGYQGEEVTDIPKGFGRMEVNVPDWFSGKDKASAAATPPKTNNHGWTTVFNASDKVYCSGVNINNVASEVHTYFLRAIMLGDLGLYGDVSGYDGIDTAVLSEMTEKFSKSPDEHPEVLERLVCGLYIMSRNTRSICADEDTFDTFYEQCLEAKHVRYEIPFVLATYDDVIHNCFTNTFPDLAGPEGYKWAVAAMRYPTDDVLVNVVNATITRAIIHDTASSNNEKDAERIKEIAAGYLMRAVFVGLLKEGNLDLPGFVTARTSSIKIAGEPYFKYFELACSGEHSTLAEDVRKLAAVGYNIMSAKPRASCFGFKMWRKNLQTLPLNTKKTEIGVCDQVKEVFPFFSTFTTSDEFTAYAASCIKEMTAAKLIEVFTAQYALSYKPFSVDSIIQQHRFTLDNMFNSMNNPAPRYHSAGGTSRDDFINTYGVVFIDEIDKLVGEPGRKSDVSREGVQRSLLKVVEGGEYAGYDTTNILFVAAGAFSGKHPSMLMPELLGRFPLRATLKKLNAEDLEAIVQLPNSEFMGAVKLIEIEGVKVHYDEDTFKFIAEVVSEINEVEDTGARRIGAVVEHVFSEAYFTPEIYLEDGYDICGATLRAKEPMEALTAARTVKEARAKIEEAAKAAELEPVEEPKGK